MDNIRTIFNYDKYKIHIKTLPDIIISQFSVGLDYLLSLRVLVSEMYNYLRTTGKAVYCIGWKLAIKSISGSSNTIMANC